MKKRGLGRGLDALLNTGVSAAHAAVSEGGLRMLPVEQLVRGRHQPRMEMRQEGLQELAESIRAQGMVQPIVVRAAAEGGRFEIIAGERRWRAAQLAGLAEVPALVREVSDQAAMAIALVENIQREDLNPLEEARALKRLIDDCNLTHQQVAEAIGRSRTAVSNLLRLLDLNTDVQQMIMEGRLEMGHARALLPLTAALQLEAARQILIRGLSVRETEMLVKRLQGEGEKKSFAEQSQDPNIRILQDDLSERLGAKVMVKHSTSGKGRLIIHYNTLDELDGIISHVK